MRSIIRVGQSRTGQPTAVILHGRTLQSSSESGVRAGYDGDKRRRGSEARMAVGMLGQLIDLTVSPANEQECVSILPQQPAVNSNGAPAAVNSPPESFNSVNTVVLIGSAKLKMRSLRAHFAPPNMLDHAQV